jgi:predicted choloylglycine hydrolase
MKLFGFVGSHFDVGLSIGKTYREKILKTLTDNFSLQDKYLPFHRTPEGKRIYQELVRLHKHHFPGYFSELEGISEGSGASFEELFLVNLREEYKSYAEEFADFGCSTCSLVTSDRAIFAHNEDGATIYDGQMNLVRLEINGKPTFTAICYPGFLPGNACGFNHEGICFSVNSVRPKRIIIGLGRHFIARSLFEAKSLEEAVELATIPGRASGFNYTIGSIKERRIVNVEVSPADHHVFEIKKSFFHANHYLMLRQVDQSIMPSSQARQNRGELLLAKGVAQDEIDLLNVLKDHEGVDYPILRDGKPPDTSVTLLTAVFDLDSKRLTIYPGGAERMKRRFEPIIEISMAP